MFVISSVNFFSQILIVVTLRAGKPSGSTQRLGNNKFKEKFKMADGSEIYAYNFK